MKKILVLTPRFPYPVIGGDRLRIYKICEELSKRYSLTLLSLCENNDEMSYHPDDGVFTDIIRIKQSKILSYLNVLKALISGKPLQIAYYKNRHYKNKLKHIIDDYDATLSHLIRVGDYVKDMSGIHILEMTDAISMNYERVRQTAPSVSLKSILYSIEYKRLFNYEKEITKKFALTSIISEVDKNYLSPSFNENVIVCGNGVDFDKFRFLNRRIEREDKINLVFIGNMYSLQNLDGVIWFIDNIFQELNINQEYRFYVLGKIKDQDKKRLEKYMDVIVSGTVEDIINEASVGHVGICPIRLGAGIQNKVLEYMALGMPVITSRVGYEGIGANINEEILIADNIDEYKSALEIIKDDIEYKNIAKKARLFVENKFRWSQQLSTLTDNIEGLLKK
ncbi:glycosyltransferase family 4 protein [Escherichia coli]|uniref:glycosyltransferase family 4 protein n=1 Tax=Escherichia coli TaxID=562 RepID=UPI0021C6F7EA|nr:glycosyltransferase family 4 protein [Escherichia coli]MCU0036427.1 glycosyltransferase family 4 protein [Escherichia coli]